MNNALIQSECRRQARLMGSAFEFIVAADRERGEGLLDICVHEVKRIENLLTEFSESSQTSLINREAWRHPVSVDHEMYELLKRSKRISHLTQGAFDITAGPLKKLYNFKNQQFEIPKDEIVSAALQKVGFEKIMLLEQNRVQLTRPDMHISFGAIGKGYAADHVRKLLLTHEVEAGVINASGDLTAWGTRPDGSPWKVGIADPNDPARMLAWIPLLNSSIATSGNYEQYFEHNGIRYSHNIDPKTGRPVSGVKSASVICPSAELADALATAVTIMGVEVGIHFIDQLPNTHCLIVDDKNRVFTSGNFNILKHSL